MNNEGTSVIGVGLMLLLAALAVAVSFMAPCGCYAGTPIKDVPARCLDVGVQPR